MLFREDSNGVLAESSEYSLDGFPFAAINGDSGTLVIVTRRSVYKFDEGHGRRRIASLPLARVLQLSVAEDESRRIFIGMRYFVVTLTPTADGYLHEWYVNQQCN
jgi:hypothetical protein